MAKPRSDSEERKPVDVWVGTSLGVLKGVSLASHEVINYCHNSLEGADRTQEVCAMCWEHGDEGEGLYCGLRNGLVQRFGCRERVFEAECDCTGGEGTFVGLGKHEEVMITCTDRGDLCFWPPEDEKVQCRVGRDLCCMAPSPDTMLQVATGGKENSLKVWDGNTPTAPIFQAKNVKNDKLDLRVPVWVTNIGYVAGSGSQPTVAVATGYHQVRLYDTRAQRRPVYSKEFGEHPFTALHVTEDGRSYIVGSSVGDITRCDLRTGGIVSRYKGCTGGVKSLQCCSNGKDVLLASCSLDRFLRVYTLNSPKLLHKVYLKLLPTRLLFMDSSYLGVTDGEQTVTVDGGRGSAEEKGESDEDDDDEDDDVWKSMKTIHETSSSRKRSRKLKSSGMRMSAAKKRQIVTD